MSDSGAVPAEHVKYISTKTNAEVQIDVATATLDQLFDAYDSLLERSIFPAKTAARYADALRALTDARPELVEHRKRLAAARTARLGCCCPPKRT